MKAYKTKINAIPGSDFREVHKIARNAYSAIKRKSKRRPYVKSKYFSKEKVFLQFYWNHLFEKKNWRDRMRRLKYFSCAIELISNSNFEPRSKENPNKRSEILHRFYGITPDNELFYVQIKENKKN